MSLPEISHARAKEMLSAAIAGVSPFTVGAVLRHKQARIAAQKRTIRAIALDILKAWKNVNYAAKPYLEAMLELQSIDDEYYFDTGRSVVLYFLSNASGFRGEKAKALKLELKAMLSH